MEFVNFQSEKFGTIRIPVLNSIERSEIEEFMSAYEAYVKERDVRRNAGGSVETLPNIQSLVDSDLLETIAIYEFMEDLISMPPKSLRTQVNLSDYLGEPS